MVHSPQAGEADTAQGSAAFQRGLDGWVEWAEGKLKLFKKGSTILHLWGNNPRHQHRLELSRGEAPGSPAAPSFQRPCGKNSNPVLCCSEWHIASRAREVALPLPSASKVLFRPAQHNEAGFTIGSLKQVLCRVQQSIRVLSISHTQRDWENSACSAGGRFREILSISINTWTDWYQ